MIDSGDMNRDKVEKQETTTDNVLDELDTEFGYDWLTPEQRVSVNLAFNRIREQAQQEIYDEIERKAEVLRKKMNELPEYSEKVDL